MTTPPAASPAIRAAASARLLWIIAALALAIIAASLARLGWPDGLRTETGGPELASLAMALFATALTALLARDTRRVSWLVPAIFAILALREMDFHDWFFEPGLLHAGIFSAPVPLWQKAVSGLLMLILTAIILAALIRGLPRLWRGLRSRAPWAYALGIAGLLAFTANNFDGIGRKLRPFGIDVPRETVRALALVEEFLELGFFFGLLVAVTLYTRQHLKSP